MLTAASRWTQMVLQLSFDLRFFFPWIVAPPPLLLYVPRVQTIRAVGPRCKDHRAQVRTTEPSFTLSRQFNVQYLYIHIMQTVCLHCTVCVQSIVYTQKIMILNKGFIERRSDCFISLLQISDCFLLVLLFIFLKTYFSAYLVLH